MFLSVVRSTSKPSASAAASKSPFLSVSQPCCAAVRTSCPVRKERMGTGVAWSNRTRMWASYRKRRGENLGGERWRFVETAGGELNHGFHLLAVEAVVPFQDVVKIGPRFEILEDGGDRHARSFQHP